MEKIVTVSQRKHVGKGIETGTAGVTESPCTHMGEIIGRKMDCKKALLYAASLAASLNSACSHRITEC